MCAVALAFLAACSAQKSEDYAGDPLARVKGTIVTSSPQAPAVPVLVWSNFARQGDIVAGAEIPVQGRFPADFTVDIVAPPRAALLNDFSNKGKLPNEVRVGVGGIYAVAPGTDVSGASHDVPVRGAVENFMVVYVEHDAVPGTIAAAFLGGALSAGFHLMRVERPKLPSIEQHRVEEACYAALPPGLTEQQEYVQCEPSGIFDHLREAPLGFDTVVTLKLAPVGELDFPNVY